MSPQEKWLYTCIIAIGICVLIGIVQELNFLRSRGGKKRDQ